MVIHKYKEDRKRKILYASQMYKVVHLASYVLQFELLMAICLSQLILFSSKARKTFKLRESDASKRKLTLIGFIFFPAKGFKYQDVKAIEHI